MSVNDSKADETGDFSVRDDSYKSGAGEIDAGNIANTTTAAETFDRIGSAAAEFNDYETKPMDRNISGLPGDLTDDVINDESPMNWIIPLVIVFLLIILGYSFCSKPPDATTTMRNESEIVKVKYRLKTDKLF